jgi:hypothetical protein
VIGDSEQAASRLSKGDVEPTRETDNREEVTGDW